MRLRRRDLLRITGATLAASALTACGGAEDEPAPTSSPSDCVSPTSDWHDAKNSGSGTLSMLSALLGTPELQDRYANNVLTGFFGSSNYQMATTYTTSDKLPDKIITALTGGTLADVVLPEYGWLHSMRRHNALEAVPDDLLTDLNVDERFLSGCRIEDTLYGVPYTMDLQVIGYRIDLLTKAGITEPPATLDALREMARELTGDGISGFDPFGPGLVRTWANLVGAYGGTLFTEDGTLSFNDGTGAAALNFLAELINDGTASLSDIPGTGKPRLITQGKAVMAPMGVGIWDELNREGLGDEAHTAFFPMPPDEAGGSPSVLKTGTVLSVARQSQYQDVAFQFLHHALEDQPLSTTAAMIPAIPSRTGLLVTSEIASNRIANAGLANIDHAGVMLGGSGAWLDLRPVIEGQLRLTLEGKQSAATAIGNLARVVSDSNNAG
ncbi:ABC transporter substrate-binding protein [Propionibacterium australiense]|uniref:Bacterial extracellular solute-binding protein n=1 Tax=Propionibacterium australiense TaxID=119981 RepID=A0A383S6J7_9ACTN|nr:extracellular solute-binding protein [Propionibacterium australiense]RLP08541.1 extracellular solute-binding protein [Propionibacterium australiense]SYZ33608.1 Bacterial extracellular solute-binding protein [Propionibacterium australiense]VEH88801.1 Maltose-binding periplasmic proteins/domains [Propionibacterium australiense]